jgi:hypothetical protein
VDESDALSCEHTAAVERLLGRQLAASRHGRHLAAVAAYTVAREEMDRCRAEHGDASPYRDVAPLPPAPEPPPSIGRQLLDGLRRMWRR